MTTAIQERELGSLTGLLGPGQVIAKPVELITYERDATLHVGRPLAVVFPQNTACVARVVGWAAERSIPVVARGEGTGLSGGAVAEHGGVMITFSHMNRVVELDRAGRSAVIEPGVINLKLDETVKKAGLYYPPDPASGRATALGGNIGENSGGPHCFKYGVTTNYVTGLEVVLADGRAAHLGGRALDYPEYDFVGLVTGSEGTLAIVTQADLRLLRNPPAVKTLMAAFDSIEQAGEAVSDVIAHGLVPATLEMMDQNMMRIIEAYVPVGLPVDAQAALIVEVDGYAESLGPQMDEIVAILRRHTSREMRVAQTAEERDRLWYGRKSAFGAMARLAPAYLVLDGSVPRSQLGPTLAEINRVCDSMQLRVANVFHAGDGNLHPLILIEDPADQELLERVHKAGRQVMELCVGQGGSITGEHGVGIEKRDYISMMYNANELGAMVDVKDAFDPRQLLNPGKIFPERAAGPAAADQRPARRTVRKSPCAPATEKDAAQVMRAWLNAGNTIRIQGAGTKSGAAQAGESVLSTRALQEIQRCDLENLYVTAGAGVPLSRLQAELEPHGMWVPLISPWPESTLGGIVSANFNAPLRMRYGGVRDLLLAANVVLPDGRFLRLGRPVVKNVAGYDMPKLFVGAYGSLGLITRLTFKLVPRPRARASLVTPVPDLERGLAWGAQLLPVCLNASSLLLCRGCQGLAETRYTLIYTVEGPSEDVAAELGQARQALEAAGAGQVKRDDERSGSQEWAAWLGAATPGVANGQEPPLTLRVGVAPKDLPNLLEDQRLVLDGTTFVADLANGLLYVRGGADLAGLGLAAPALGGYALGLAGPLASRIRYTPASQELMHRLKARWDANGQLNPGVPVGG